MSDITTTRIFTDGERGITAAKLNDIVGSSTIQPAFYTSKPTAGSADPTDIALILKAGAYAQVPISALAGSATQAQIWSTRLRSYNSVMNPNFEVDQVSAGTTLTNIAASAKVMDRWWLNRSGTYTINGGQVNQGVILPGTSFRISNFIYRVTLTAAQASLGVNDYLLLGQNIEGSVFREIVNDVFSISLLVRSSVAGLNFGVTVQDQGPTTKTLTNLCTIPTANTWTLIQLPNLPAIPVGNFTTLPGTAGQLLRIVLAAGSSQTSPANGTWQNGNFLGAIGQSNFAGSPVNSTLEIAFCQLEPGAVCSTLMDKPFAGANGNLEECQRYYTKSYQYGNKAGAVDSGGTPLFTVPFASNAGGYGWFPFAKRMAKIPTVVGYSPVTGTANVLRVISGTASDWGYSSVVAPGEVGFSGFTIASPPGAASTYQFHYTADTGW